MSVLAIITARGGSKRLPGKNMRPFCGMPLIGWTLQAALHSYQDLEVIAVTTDSQEIADYCIEFDSSIRIVRRPASLATDTASSYDAVKHAWNMISYDFTGVTSFNYICLLQPTSPLRTCEDIIGCIDVARQSATGYGAVSRTLGETAPNGAVYVGNTDWLLHGGNFSAPGIDTWWMPPHRSFDINTLADFEDAEAAYALSH